MFDPSSKTSPKLPNRRNGISNGNTNHRPSSRCATSTCREKGAAMPRCKVSVCPVSPSESTAKKAYDSQIKMKLIDLAPRNPAKETSEGVQEFIKHVSDFIEKKNPFKETVVFSPVRPRRKEVNTASINSIQFNGARKKPGEKKKTEDVIVETNKTTVEKNPAEKSNLTPQKTEVIGTKGRISRPMSVARKRDEEKKYERGYSLPRRRSESTPGKNLTGGSSSCRENKVAEVKSCRQPPQRPVKPCAPVIHSQKKSRRPSEIPLRKNRTDLAKKPNTVSLLMQKPLKDVESESSLDVYTKDDIFPAMEDFGLCSEVQMTINFSSERLSTPGESQTLSTSEDESDSTNTSPRISIFEEFTEEKSVSGKKTKVIDVGKVKTSSFTVIRTSSAVLTKLESLHKQNVNAREKSFNEKASGKQKAVAPKASINSLKGKTSKKSLYSRTSNKGNKPGLKTKQPKKEEIPEKEDSKIEKKPPETKAQAPYPNFRKEVVSECRKTENRQKKEENQPPARKPLYGSLNPPRKPANPKAKEELEKATNTQINPKSELQSESHKLEKPKITRNPSLSRPSKHFLKISNSEEKQVSEWENGRMVDILKPEKEVPTTPPPTPETVETTVISGIHCEQTEEEEEWSAKTMIFGATNDKFHWCGISSEEKSESEESRAILQKSNPSSIESMASTKPKKLDLVVKGTPLTFIKDSSDSTKDSEQPALKKHLMIDLRTQEDTIEYRVVEDNSVSKSHHNLVPGREEKSEEASCDFGSSSDAGKEVRKNEKKNFTRELKPTKPRSPSLVFSKPRKSFSSLKRKPQYKSGTKVGRKKKIRSDAGDRLMPFARNLFDSKTKIKPDAKLRSGLTKPSKRDENQDVFDDAYEVKLRRRNSEPISFRGYVWKRTDSTTPRGHQASVSSMTSSLRHLNTDDIDDFILWEAIPQKMTSCWEMSLYHIRRPWSVLSCSVFKDNRMSSTPGLILKNLRNDSRRAAIIQNERSTCRKENPFDVEPSIAQKNIDIRNWLAALNFQTPPSTSTDGFTEGNFHTQLALDTQNLNKVQVNPKRRKVLSGLKFSEEVAKKKIEEKEKHRKFSKWNSSDGEGLTDLIRRKSGGFVTKEQFLNSEHSAQRPNVTVNLCVYSKSAEDSFLVETNDRGTTCEPRKYKSVEVTAQPEVSISATIINSRAGVGDQAAGKVPKVKEKPQEAAKPDKDSLVASLKQEMNLFFSDVNIWKYLFLLTLCVVVIHYCYSNSYMYRH